MKKLLFLGGSDIQVSAIKRAKLLGCYVITCDYLPNNPGHKFSDKYYNVSTTDLNGILNVAKLEKIDGIVAYASEPAALAASYVSEKLNLEGTAMDIINILTNKDVFRSYLLNNGYPCPSFKLVESLQDITDFLDNYGISILKPVASSGSKGIEIIDHASDLKNIYEKSKQYSNNNRVIIEKFIKLKGQQICGDIVVIEGQLIFSSFGNVHFDSSCSFFTPCSITLPINNGQEVKDRLNVMFQRLVSDLNIQRGVYNVDVIIGEDNKDYIIDIGARNGGNMLTEIISFHSGLDIVKIIIESSFKKIKINDLKNEFGWAKDYWKEPDRRFFAHYVLHSTCNGKLDRIAFSEEIEKNIFYKFVSMKKGDLVNVFKSSSDRLGLCLMSFDDYDKMINVVNNFSDYVSIEFVND